MSDELEDDVQYDLAGNPLPVQPRQSPPPSAAYPQPSQAQYPSQPAPRYGSHPPVPPPYPGPGGMPQYPSSTGGQRPGGNMPGFAAPREKSKVGLIAALAAAFIAILVIIFFASANKPVAIVAPTAYTPVDSPDKTFSCKGPAGWEVKTAGVQGSTIAGVVFQKDGAKIDITSDMQSSFMVDGWRTPPSSDPADPPPPSPILKLHSFLKPGKDMQPNGYKELPPDIFTSSVSAQGESCISEWTGEGGMLGGKLHGYRATLIGHDRVFTVNCQCPESDWKTLKDSFVAVVNSIVPGTG